MPTGYTEVLFRRDDVTFKEFALRCARAFGALIEMRDSGLEAPLPEKFEPSNYHTKAIAKAEREWRRLSGMGGLAKLSYGRRQRTAELLSMRKSLKKSTAQDVKLDSMTDQVNKWNPPTKDHSELKNFMLNQLKISKNGTDWYKQELDKTEARSPMEFYREAVDKCRRDIAYHTGENEKEIARTDERNKWLAELRKSLQ